MSSEGLSAEERGVLAGLRAGDPGAADRLASLDDASQQRVVAALAQPEGPELAEAGPVTSGSGAGADLPGGEVRARPPGRSRLLGPLVVLVALVVVAAGGYLLYGRMFGDDASVVVDSSRREDRDRSRDDADDSAGSGEASSDGQRQVPEEAKPAKPDGDQGPAESSAVKPAPEPMAEQEVMAEAAAAEAALAEAQAALEAAQAEVAAAQAEARAIAEAVVEEPMAEEEPTEEEPMAEEEPMEEEPMAEEPMAEEPMAEEPMAEEPMAEEPMAEEPMAEEPMAEEPMAEEPMAEEEPMEEMALPGEGVSVTAGRANWSSGYFQAEVYKLLLEELGYNVSDPGWLELGPNNGYIAMAQGDMDYWPNSWYPFHLAWHLNELPDGSLVGDHVSIVGEEMIEGGLQGFLVTKSFADEYGVYTMDELNEAYLTLRDGSGWDSDRIRWSLAGCGW